MSIAARQSQLVDLSQPYFNGMSTSEAHGVPSFTTRGLPASYMPRGLPAAAVDGIAITDLAMSAHMGTHVDAARHFFPEGKTIDEYPVERFHGPGVVLDVRRRGVVPVTLDEVMASRTAIRRGDIVLFCFGYGALFGTPEYEEHPYLAEEVAEYLRDREVGMVGVDVITPDLPASAREDGFDWPVHRHLLGNDVLIIENLGPKLELLTGRRLSVAAVPLAICGADGAPARVVASTEAHVG